MVAEKCTERGAGEVSSHILTIGTMLDGKPLCLDREQLIAGKALITAASGGGKSYALRKMLEQCGQIAQTIVLDWEGEFASLREKLDIAIVGPGGELPADVRSAGLLARRLMEKEISAVIDISDLKSYRARQEFVRRFVEEMVELPKHLWHDVFIALDEAQMMCPEKGQGDSESTEAVVNLCTVGRKRGFGVIAATQRLSMFNKTAAAQLLTKFVGQANLDLDVRRAAFDLGVPAKKAQQMLRPVNRNRKDPSEGLITGEFYGYGPALIESGVTRFRFDACETTHPKRGQGRNLTPPKPSSAITAVVAEMADLPKEAEQEIRDLETAKRKLAELERALKRDSRPLDEKQIQTAKAEAASEVRGPLERQVQQLRQGLEIAMNALQAAEGKPSAAFSITRQEIAEPLNRAIDSIHSLVQNRSQKALADHENIRSQIRTAISSLQGMVSMSPAAVAAITSLPTRILPANSDSDEELNPAVSQDARESLTGPQCRIIDAIAFWESIGVTVPTETAITLKSGYVAATNTSYVKARGQLRQMGLIKEESGSTFSLTSSGRLAAQFPSRLGSLSKYHARILAELSGPCQKILNALLPIFPAGLNDEQLAFAAGYENPDARSSYVKARGQLKTMDLIEIRPDECFVATKTLFPEGLS